MPLSRWVQPTGHVQPTQSTAGAVTYQSDQKLMLRVCRTCGEGSGGYAVLRAVGSCREGSPQRDVEHVPLSKNGFGMPFVTHFSSLTI